MSVALSLGVAFGLTIFENIALGLPVEMCMGIAIGASMDADAKKKGENDLGFGRLILMRKPKGTFVLYL